MSSVPEIPNVIGVGTLIFCSPTVSDSGPVLNTLKRDDDNRIASRMSQRIGRGGQWSMIQSNVVLKSLQPIVICRPMGSHFKQKCIYIRLCIRLIHGVYLEALYEMAKGTDEQTAQCLRSMRKSFAVTCMKHFAEPRGWLSYSCTRCNREDASFDCPVALALIAQRL